MVEFGNDVSQRTAHVTEGDGAVHTPGALLFGFGLGPGLIILPEIMYPFPGRAAFRREASKFHESGNFTHD